jgi:hypothetical protein
MQDSKALTLTLLIVLLTDHIAQHPNNQLNWTKQILFPQMAQSTLIKYMNSLKH